MLPTRGPIKVKLEDTGTTSGVQCRQTAQVRILRRPKPIAGDNQQVGSSSSARSSSNNIGNSKGSDSNKKILSKTYQERADDYAKARLRILGSAFPDKDNSLTNNDDNNRMLNLDHEAQDNNNGGLSVHNNRTKSSTTATTEFVNNDDDYDEEKRVYEVMLPQKKRLPHFVTRLIS